ncbi:unnamed protein product [Phytophthora fragariaefolia]|uniref:Unnamed protein product n=1 Tax=Phytophthora fragariaefolia TaxID=1490495 RepID=A0A9W6X629_9STRA|nr:unnamed protein product [Phytophthora fragariaefolia]
MEVRQIVDHRVNVTTDELELLGAWLGLQDIENSSVRVTYIQRDVPALVAKYAEDMLLICCSNTFEGPTVAGSRVMVNPLRWIQLDPLFVEFGSTDRTQSEHLRVL